MVFLSKALLFLSWVLLVPWYLFAGLSGLAFDSGDTPLIRTFVYASWTYPISVVIATILRKKW